jgi:death-on-curing protein
MNAQLKIGQPRFLTKDEVLSLHRASIDMYGGADGVLNDGSLESALAQPRQAYGYHLAMNHAFRDGNKRTAFAAMVVFLRMNGWNFELPDEHAADLMLEMIAEHRDKSWLAERLAAGSRARPSLELRDFFSSLDTAVHFAQIQALSRSINVASSSETNATIDEACAAMPILKHLLERVHQLEEEGNTQASNLLKSQSLLLIDLFRIAEDVGYEW